MRWLMVILFLVSCRKMAVEIPIEQTVESQQRTIGDIARTPDLIIETMSNEYDGYSTGFGLHYTASNFSVYQSNLKWYLRYNCPIANIAQQGTQNDFVVDMSNDGIPIGSGGYNFPGLLAISIFQDGLPVFPVKKETFQNQTTAFKNNYNWNIHTTYQWDTAFIHAQGADRYINTVQVKGSDTPEDSKYLVVVEVNPELFIRESRYDNNVSVLPARISDGIGYLDFSATDENKTRSATNLTGIYNGKGKSKHVALDWDCPYHEPIYVKHWFTVKRNGIIIAENLHDSQYSDPVTGNFRVAKYEVIVNVPGLGASLPSSINVVK